MAGRAVTKYELCYDKTFPHLTLFPISSTNLFAFVTPSLGLCRSGHHLLRGGGVVEHLGHVPGHGVDQEHRLGHVEQEEVGPHQAEDGRPHEVLGQMVVLEAEDGGDLQQAHQDLHHAAGEGLVQGGEVPLEPADIDI